MAFSDIFVKIIVPILAALGGAGGLVGYWAYRSAKLKTHSDDKKIDADIASTFAKEWRDLYEEMSKKMEKMEARYEKRVQDLESLIAKKEEEHVLAVQTKDAKIKELEGRISTLEKELLKYQDIGNKVETAKESIHAAVDDNLGEIPKP